MSSVAAYLLQQLRQQFDSSFEQAPEPPNEYEDLLFIRVGEQPFAVPVAEIKGLAKLERLTPIPSSASGFVGLSSARGDILAVFELSTLMGMNAGSQKLNWLLIAAGHDCALALGFSEIEGYSRIPKAQLQDSHAGMIRQTVAFQGQAVGLIAMETLVRKICEENGEPHGQ